LAREKHFGRAAEKCGISQPALSNAIRQLEKELGVNIVKRARTFEGLTPEGAKVLEYASRVMNASDALSHELALMQEGLAGTLKVGVMASALPMLALITYQFCRTHPTVKLTVLSKRPPEIQRGLEDFSLDLGLTYLDVDPVPRGKTHPVYHEHYWVLTPIDGPLEGRNSVTWRELVDMPLVLFSPDTISRRLVDQAFSEIGLQATPQIETNSMLNLSAYVRSGYWSSVVPRECFVFCSEPPGTRILPVVEPEISHQVGLVMLDQDPPSVLAQSLFDFVASIEVDILLSMSRGEPK
jgi:DNA-binding transcriptional LysR family regulator